MHAGFSFSYSPISVLLRQPLSIKRATQELYSYSLQHSIWVFVNFSTNNCVKFPPIHLFNIFKHYSFYSVSSQDFLFKGHWKGWALKIKSFWAPPFWGSTPSNGSRYGFARRHGCSKTLVHKITNVPVLFICRLDLIILMGTNPFRGLFIDLHLFLRQHNIFWQQVWPLFNEQKMA
jgi:hypothetical protein